MLHAVSETPGCETNRAVGTSLLVDGARGTTLAAVRSLGRAGWDVVVPARTPLAASRFASAAVELPDAVIQPDVFVKRVEELVAAGGIDLLVPASDATMYLLYERCRFEQAPAILGGDRRSFDLVADKARLLSAAESAGFAVPRWHVPAGAKEAADAAADIGYPCVVKPRRSYLAAERFFHRRHRYVRRPSELADALEALAEPDGELPLIQEHVPGRALATTAVMHGGRPLAVAARETLSFEPAKGGTSVWKRTVPLTEVGVADSLRLLEALEFEGLAEVEYQVDRCGTPRLMEINARLHGWVPLAMAAGVDLPRAAARAAMGWEPEPADGYRAGLEMRWPGGELLRIRQLLARDPDLPPDKTRFGELRKAWPIWRPGMRYDSVDFTDAGPALARARRLFRGSSGSPPESRRSGTSR
jgi:predicted ATP-grasp superfamily ATP-dependent carboligase